MFAAADLLAARTRQQKVALPHAAALLARVQLRDVRLLEAQQQLAIAAMLSLFVRFGS